MKDSYRREVGVKRKIMVQGEGGGGRSYYDHVIPNIIAFVLHHWMEKGIFVKVLSAGRLLYQVSNPFAREKLSWFLACMYEG